MNCSKCENELDGKYFACNELKCRKEKFSICEHCYLDALTNEKERIKQQQQKKDNNSKDGDSKDLSQIEMDEDGGVLLTKFRLTLHPHPLFSFEYLPAKIMYRAKVQSTMSDSSSNRTTRTLLLSNVGAALPSSNFLKKENIVGVLTLLDFRGALGFDSSIMKSMFSKPIKKKQQGENQEEEESSEKEGHLLRKTTLSPDGNVAYHLIHLPDTSTPDILRQTWKMSPTSVLLEACSWIETALKYGNVLIHCEKGQRRSPLVTIAFMMFTQRMSSHEVIAQISRTHADSDWADQFKKSRTDWIKYLQEWKPKAKPKFKKWNEMNKDKITRWVWHLKKAVEAHGSNVSSKMGNSTTSLTNSNSQSNSQNSKFELSQNSKHELSQSSASTSNNNEITMSLHLNESQQSILSSSGKRKFQDSQSSSSSSSTTTTTSNKKAKHN